MRRHGGVVAVLVASVLACVATPADADSRADKLKAARAAAAALHAAAGREQTAARVAQDRLVQLSDAANAALAAYVQAADAEAKAAAQSAAEQQKLSAAQLATTTARDKLADYAREAYIAGPADDAMGPLLLVMDSRSPSDAMGALGLLRQTGSAMSLVLNNFRVAQAVQSHEASLAAAWSAALQRAREVQRQAKASADRAVAEQRVLLLHVKAVALATSRAATRADATAARLKRELDAEIAAARARAAAAARAAVTARCRGGDISGYPNGQIPVDRLCPLYGAPGEELRRDAAATFNSMSRAFQRSFGVPLCLADSYRTYQRQQELYASEPAYAAYPGTSQHGWARAVDLCGGVQNDGTPQNSWMRTHAAQYNWFHPTWAEAGGGGPYEPWHWEFAG